MNLTEKQILSIEAAARRLNVPVLWLRNIIRFESNFNPQAKNPYSSARGLLQFIDKTAAGLGYADSLDLVTKNPTFEGQIDNAVIPYLEPFGPFNTPQSLYLSVFYPAARSWPLDKQFPKWVQDVNPGIVTVRDYVEKVDFINNLPTLRNVSILLTILFLVYKIIKKGNT